MKRSDFFNMTTRGVTTSVRSLERNVLRSVANPMFAQTPRQMIFNPIPGFVPRQLNYSAGVLYDNLQPFDKMYADKLDVFGAAQSHSEKTKKQLDELQKQYDASLKDSNAEK